MGRYVVDKGQSRLTVKAFAGGMLAAFGHNPVLGMRDIAGEAQLDPETPGAGKVSFRVRPESLEVLGDVKSSDRRDIEKAAREEVFETSKYPEIVFECDKVLASQAGVGYYRLDAPGELTLRGSTQRQLVSGHASLHGDLLRINGETLLRQTAYGVKLYAAAGGALKVKDEVKVSFEIVARLQDGEEG